MNKTIKVSLCSLLTLQLSACATSSETRDLAVMLMLL